MKYILLILVGSSLGIAYYTFYYANGASYLSSEPKSCMNCHVMKEQYDSWSKSSHHQVTNCNSCHSPENHILKYFNKGENGFWHSLKFTTGKYKDPIRIRPHNKNIVLVNCIKCHGDLFQKKPMIQLSHNEYNDCLHCHKDIGHTH